MAAHPESDPGKSEVRPRRLSPYFWWLRFTKVLLLLMWIAHTFFWLAPFVILDVWATEPLFYVKAFFSVLFFVVMYVVLRWAWRGGVRLESEYPDTVTTTEHPHTDKEH